MPPPRIELRAVRPEDLPAHFEQQRDEASVRMAAVPPRERAAFDEHWAAVLADPSVVVRTVLADGIVAGHVTSFVIDGQRHVGYWIAREHWNRGIASAALGELLGEVLERPLFATVATHNPASRRVLEKAGFRCVEERQRGDVRLWLLRLD
jgi:RimJ/RimL family protein N-acetyltransferase